MITASAASPTLPDIDMFWCYQFAGDRHHFGPITGRTALEVVHWILRFYGKKEFSGEVWVLPHPNCYTNKPSAFGAGEHFKFKNRGRYDRKIDIMSIHTTHKDGGGNQWYDMNLSCGHHTSCTDKYLKHDKEHKDGYAYCWECAHPDGFDSLCDEPDCSSCWSARHGLP
jgi:hypothetical protein